MDNVHIGIAKRLLVEPEVDATLKQGVLDTIREIMGTDHKTYVYHLPLPTLEPVYVNYPLEDESGALAAAHKVYREILDRPRNHLPETVKREIVAACPGILPECLNSQGGS